MSRKVRENIKKLDLEPTGIMIDTDGHKDRHNINKQNDKHSDIHNGRQRQWKKQLGKT